MARALLAFGILFGLCAAFCTGWVGGRWFTGRSIADEQQKRDAEHVAPVLAADPAFQKLIPCGYPVGGYCLSGPVPTQADYDRLWSALARLLGEPRMTVVLNDVWVEETLKQ